MGNTSKKTFDPLNHLNALKAFNAVIDCGTVKAAALQLNITDGAVSRLVRQLEESCDVRLFDRRNRKLIPTSQGLAFWKEVHPAFLRLKLAPQALEKAPPVSHFTIAAPATFLSRWLIPRQRDLEAAVGNVEVRFATYHGPVSQADPDISIFITVGPEFYEPELDYIYLMQQELVLVASPKLFVPGSLSKLQPAPRLTPKSFPSLWSLWEDSGGETFEYTDEIFYERMHYVIEATQVGMGFTVAPVEFLEKDLNSNRLASPCKPIKFSDGYRLYIPPKKRDLNYLHKAEKWFLKTARPAN